MHLNEQAEKLLEFLKSAEGKLFLDSLEGYSLIALTAVNPLIGMTWSTVSTLAEIIIDVNLGNNLDVIQKLLEHRIANRFGIVGELAVIKLKQAWDIIQIPQVKNAFSLFVKDHIFQNSYTKFSNLANKPSTFSTYFDQDVIPNFQTYFQDAVKEYLTNLRKINSGNGATLAFTAAQMNDAINAVLRQQTIAGLSLNLGIQYNTYLDSNALNSFNSYVDNTLNLGISRFKSVFTDNNIAYTDLGGDKHYLGEVNVNGLPHGEGIILTTDGGSSVSCKDGVQLNKNNVNGVSTMLQETAALVSIAYTLYNVMCPEDNYMQDINDSLERTNNLLATILTQLRNIPAHINTQFDEQTAKDAIADASAARVTLSGVREYNTIDRARAFQDSRLMLTRAFHRITQLPSGNNKLVFAPVIYICANHLAAVTIMEFLFFPQERRAIMVETLMDIQYRLSTYKKNVHPLIDGRFSEPVVHIIEVDFPQFGAVTVSGGFSAGSGRMPVIAGASASYNFDQSTISEDRNYHGMIPSLQSVRDAVKNNMRKKIDVRVADHKKRLYEEVKPTLDLLKNVQSICEKFLVEYSFQNILGHECKSIKTILWGGANMSCLDLQGGNFKDVPYLIASSQQGKERVESAFKKMFPHSTLNRSDRHEWIKVLAKDGYHQMCLEMAGSKEGRDSINKIFKEKFGHEPKDINHWVELLAKDGYQELIRVEVSSATRPTSLLGSAMDWAWQTTKTVFTTGKGLVSSGYQHATGYFSSQPTVPSETQKQPPAIPQDTPLPVLDSKPNPAHESKITEQKTAPKKVNGRSTISSFNQSLSLNDYLSVIVPYVSHYAREYSPITLPWNRVRDLAKAEKSKLEKNQIILLQMTKDFTSQKTGLAAQCPHFSEQFVLVEKTLAMTQQQVTQIIFSNKVTNAVLSIIEKNTAKIGEYIQKIAQENQTLRYMAIKERRIQRRNERVGKRSATIISYDATNCQLKQRIIRDVSHSAKVVEFTLNKEKQLQNADGHCANSPSSFWHNPKISQQSLPTAQPIATPRLSF